MSELIRLTENWTTVTANATQPISSALDVLEYDILDLMIVTGLDSPGSPSFTLQLLTGTSLMSSTAWIAVPGATATISTDRITNVKALPTITGGFYRYVRWQVALTNITTARFLVEGVGRKYR